MKLLLITVCVCVTQVYSGELIDKNFKTPSNWKPLNDKNIEEFRTALNLIKGISPQVISDVTRALDVFRDNYAASKFILEIPGIFLGTIVRADENILNEIDLKYLFKIRGSKSEEDSVEIERFLDEFESVLSQKLSRSDVLRIMTLFRIFTGTPTGIKNALNYLYGSNTESTTDSEGKVTFGKKTQVDSSVPIKIYLEQPDDWTQMNDEVAEEILGDYRSIKGVSPQVIHDVQKVLDNFRQDYAISRMIGTLPKVLIDSGLRANETILNVTDIQYLLKMSPNHNNFFRSSGFKELCDEFEVKLSEKLSASEVKGIMSLLRISEQTPVRIHNALNYLYGLNKEFVTETSARALPTVTTKLPTRQVNKLMH